MYWALKPELASRYERAITAGMVPSAAQLEQYSASRSTAALAGGMPECLTIAGDVAQIKVEGVLTAQPDIWAWLIFGANTAYSEIVEALAAASVNADVKRVEWIFASPGGTTDGFFDALAAIEAFTKPSKARASMACSAAFALATMAGKIEATTPAAQFGSVGVVASCYVDGPAATKVQVDITSTEAPDKRPDVKTDEGQAVIRRQLDVLHDLMVDAIARGRTRAGRATTIDDANASFGRGAVVFAEDARAAGMIDRVPPRKPRASSASASAAPSSLRSDAMAMAELFGSKRDDETDDEYTERFAAFATSLTPKGGASPTRPKAPERDLGDRMADAMHLPTDEEHDARLAHDRERRTVLAAELGIPPQLAAQLRLPPAPPQRTKVTLNLSVPEPAQRPRGRDAGDRMADAMGLPPDPQDERITKAVTSLVAELRGVVVPAALAPLDAAAVPVVRPARPDGKDLGDLMADAMGLPQDPGTGRAELEAM